MPRIASGTRDGDGRWRADDPAAYPPMDVHGTLPWSVLRQDAPGWQARKRHWLELGVDDPGPRAHAAGMAATGRHGAVSGGVSRFDPHLAEVLYAWYCPPGGTVLDPFAGGPVRGLVAAALGRAYTGIDLSAPQTAANRARADAWREDGALGPGAPAPVWLHGPAQDLLPAMGPQTADFVLTCPPYHNRERYSADPRDLSAMPWARFESAYRGIIAASFAALRPDRFAAWVVGDVRDHRGHLRGLPALTVDAARAAGAHHAAEFILVAPRGTLGKLMRPAWEAARTPMGLHQRVLVFAKGDRRAAARHTRGARRC